MERMFHFGLVILIKIGQTSWRGGGTPENNIGSWVGE